MAKITWSSFDEKETNELEDKYLPKSGEGDNMATQAVTATSKLIFKYFNDGDVFDNNYYLRGWANDISSYANWLEAYVDGAGEILRRIDEVMTEDEYVEEILYPLYKLIFRKDLLEKLEKNPANGSVYDCDGPFNFIDDDDEYDEYDDDDYDEYDEDDEYDEYDER